MECPKCQYVRQEIEAAPEWQCPKCGIAYQKFKAEPQKRAANPAQEHIEKKAFTTSLEPKGVEKKNKTSFKDIRVAILMLVLLFVVLDKYFIKANTSDWDQPLRVVIYPVNGDGSSVSDAYIAGLNESGFSPVNQFMRREAARYGIAIKDPLDIRLGPMIAEKPPLPPEDQNIVGVIMWSLSFRYWSFTVDTYDGPRPDIRIYTMYYDPKAHSRLPHSTGIEQGMLSIVHAFADKKMAKQNKFVITHEMLHTLGATDKYSFTDNLPIFPDGYAEPEKKPLYPQRYAEVMGGRIPLDQIRAKIPAGLGKTIVGPLTAWEIGWIKPEAE